MSAAREREEFSKRLTQKLREHGLDAASPTLIAQQFNRRAPTQSVTAQAVRKWLSGEAIPSQPKVRAIAEWFGISADWLRYGGSVESTAPARQPLAAYRPALSDQELVKRYRRLSVEHQALLTEIIGALSERKLRS